MNSQPKVVAITATAGRHRCIERSVRFFLDQDYSNCVQLIYQNSPIEQRLNTNIDPSRVMLVNRCTHINGGQPYKTLGAIYNDAITYVPEDTDLICFWDDDDIFLPNHISEGVAGFLRGGKKAYKPLWSYYRGERKVVKVQNNMEPSVFVLLEHIKEYGFSDTTTEQHLQWMKALGQDLYVDPNGTSTMIYNWGDDFFTWKTSGDPNNPENFNNYRKQSKDHGDGIITPLSRAEADNYYKLVKNAS
jgi:hypothetical protein